MPPNAREGRSRTSKLDDDVATSMDIVRPNPGAGIGKKPVFRPALRKGDGWRGMGGWGNPS